eukprot:623141-Alexandrium_andersonii.AAC.1
MAKQAWSMVAVAKGSSPAELVARPEASRESAREASTQQRQPGYWKLPAPRNWSGMPSALHAAMTAVRRALPEKGPWQGQPAQAPRWEVAEEAAAEAREGA